MDDLSVISFLTHFSICHRVNKKHNIGLKLQKELKTIYGRRKFD